MIRRQIRDPNYDISNSSREVTAPKKASLSWPGVVGGFGIQIGSCPPARVVVWCFSISADFRYQHHRSVPRGAARRTLLVKLLDRSIEAAQPYACSSGHLCHATPSEPARLRQRAICSSGHLCHATPSEPTRLRQCSHMHTAQGFVMPRPVSLLARGSASMCDSGHLCHAAPVSPFVCLRACIDFCGSWLRSEL